jgi:hypothetical protein
MKSSERTNEDLIKRARYGGRNVGGLAILASLAAGFGALGIFAYGGEDLLWFALPFLALAASYWCLAIAARRGDHRALTVILSFLSVLFLFSLVMAVFVHVKTNGASPANIIWIVIPLLVIIALAQNRSDLLELRKRSLWEFVFGTSRLNNSIIVVGGVLMFVGYSTLFAGMVAGLLQAAGIGRFNRDFKSLILVDEKDFMEAFRVADPSRGADGLSDTMTKLNRLETKARSLAERTSGNSGLEPIVAKYNKAISAWRSALEALRSEGRMSVSIQDKLQEADRLRQEVLTEFDRRFAKPSPSAR